MKLHVFSEAIAEDAALRVFSRLVNITNGIAELLDQVGSEPNHDLTSELEASGASISSTSNRIASMGMSNSLWKSLKTSIVSAQDIGNSWMEFQAMLTRRLIPEIVLSLTQLTGGSIENVDAKLAVAKERVQNLQEIITGMAPTSGVAPSADVETVPSATPAAAPPGEATPDDSPEASP